MRTAVPEKILKIVEDIEAKGDVPLTRLTVLKKWFEQRPARLGTFGLWIARRSAGRKGKAKGLHGDLLDEARKLMGSPSTREGFLQQIDPQVARAFYEKARGSQNKYENQNWGAARIVESWPLFLVEEGLALHAGIKDQSSDGYRLAAQWAQNYDPHYGNGLNGPSAGKLNELVRFMFHLEALEYE